MRLIRAADDSWEEQWDDDLVALGNNVGQIDEIDFGDVVYQVEITRGGADNAGFDPEGDQARTVPGLL